MAQSLRRAALRLAQNARILPSSLYISDVTAEAVHAWGHNAIVWKGAWDNKKVAIKKFRWFFPFEDNTEHNRNFRRVSKQSFLTKRIIPSLNLASIQTLCREVVIWSHVQHRNLVPFYGCYIDSSDGQMCVVAPWVALGDFDKVLGPILKAQRSIDDVLLATMVRDFQIGIPACAMY